MHLLSKSLKILGYLLISLTLLIALLFFWISEGVFSHQYFNKQLWLVKLTDKSDYTCYRGGMANYIKLFVLKNTMNKLEVSRVLGDWDFAEENWVEYTLGTCSGFQIDFDGLRVYFDSQGYVEKSMIIQH